MERKTCASSDGVRIVYSAAGSGDTALVFIHGGMADRSFFDRQLEALAGRYRVIALDLAGHGESGTNRTTWAIQQFGADVKAVVESERLNRLILFGNSLGGPVAVEAALLLPDRVLGVVGIDTFHDLASPESAESRQRAVQALRQRAEAFRADYTGAMKAMVRMLFHQDAEPSLIAETERRMLRTSPEVAYGVLRDLGDSDYRASVRKLTLPLRAINGDLYPTNVKAIRQVKADFDAVVMPHMGHYPMLERPDEFNRHVAQIAEVMTSRRQ